MIADNKKFFTGFGLLIGFVVFIVIIFLPIFHGKNGLEYMDSLYNSISKGSANYIPELEEKAGDFQGKHISVVLKMGTKSQAEQTAQLFKMSGSMTSIDGETITVDGDFGQILKTCLTDSELMYNNKGEEITAKYHLEGRQVLFDWYRAFRALDKALSDQNRFREAEMVQLVAEKAIECAYNYYNIEPRQISDSMGIVIFSLLFYVVYTVWYGFSFMFMFEGWGMRLGH